MPVECIVGVRAPPLFVAHPIFSGEEESREISCKDSCPRPSPLVSSQGPAVPGPASLVVMAAGVMGLAITANDGKVYVIEDAHKLYTNVYRRRFEGLRLAVTGRELKREGNIVWIQPSRLDLPNK